MMNMKITFAENPYLPNSDLNPEYVTTIPLPNEYFIKLLHTYEGIGMTDKYRAVTYMEIYKGKENITENFYKNVVSKDTFNNMEFPVVATTNLLSQIIMFTEYLPIFKETENA